MCHNKHLCCQRQSVSLSASATRSFWKMKQQQALGSTSNLANGAFYSKILILEVIDIELNYKFIVLSGQIKASEDHRPRSKLLCRALYLRPTYDKLEYVCPALFLLRYDKVWKENKLRRDTRQANHNNRLTPALRKARKFKWVLINVAFKQNNY